MKFLKLFVFIGGFLISTTIWALSTIHESTNCNKPITIVQEVQAGSYWMCGSDTRSLSVGMNPTIVGSAPCTFNVCVTQNGKETTCDKAVYRCNTQLKTCQGMSSTVAINSKDPDNCTPENLSCQIVNPNCSSN